MPDQKQTPSNQAAIKQQVQAAKQEPSKTVTNDTATSTDSKNAELQPQSSVSVDTGKESITAINDLANKDSVATTPEQIAQIVRSESLEGTKEVLKEIELSKAIPTEVNLQNEKKLQEALKVQIPTAGRVVTFFFDKGDGICTNNMVTSLPATVVLPNELITNLAVFTLDSRDPIVLRKEVPHISIAPRDSEGIPVKPYWNWPVITR